MKKTLLKPHLEDIPFQFHLYFENANVYDSSCSPMARVVYIEKDGGYYLKCSEKGSLKKEALLDEYFSKKGIGAKVLDYFSGDKDWLLTERVPGEDCTHADYLSDPKRLCDTVAERLRALHEMDCRDCPVIHTEEYFKTVEQNRKKGLFDSSFADGIDAEAAWRKVQENKHLFKTDTLLHGDYCLPNIMLNNWSFSGFIDLGNGGVGDRHVDLFWGAWTLEFNLKTNEYRERFFDAYGRDKIEREMIDVVAAAETFG